MLDAGEAADEVAQVASRVPVDGVAVKEAGLVLARDLLPRIDERGPLEEERQRGEALEVKRTARERGDAGHVVVLEEAKLVVVARVDRLLEVEKVEPVAERGLAA